MAIANEIGQQINSERPHKDLELVRMALDWPVKNLVKVSLCRSLIKNPKTHEGSTSTWCGSDSTERADTIWLDIPLLSP